tara:strand:- start:319 stop:585 length:267 start_codon:yes stop_codon:yes gene_type:complete
MRRRTHVLLIVLSVIVFGGLFCFVALPLIMRDFQDVVYGVDARTEHYEQAIANEAQQRQQFQQQIEARLKHIEEQLAVVTRRQITDRN